VLAGKHLAHAVASHEAEIARRQVEGNGPLLAGPQFETLETTQRETRRTFELGRIQIELRDFLACMLARCGLSSSPAVRVHDTVDGLDPDRPYSNVE
jgi:hypothetical protein